MSEMIDDLEGQVDALETSLGGAIGMAAQFDAELKRIHETFSATGRGAAKLEATLSRGVARAIDGVVLDGMKLSDALQTVAQSMIDAAWKAAVTPVANHVGGCCHRLCRACLAVFRLLLMVPDLHRGA